MPTFLSLDLVLAIVRLAAAREHPDEDSPTHHQRVAHLSLVCKAFRDEVQPLLWRTLQLKRMEHFHRLAARRGRNRRLELVEELRGGNYGLHGWDLQDETDDAAYIMCYTLPNLRDYRSTQFGRRRISMEAFPMFEHLTTLHLSCHRLEALPLNFQLPLLETLSLKSCKGPGAIFQRLLAPSCTPKLQKLHIANPEAGNTTFAPEAPNLRRLECVLINAWDSDWNTFDALGIDQAPVIAFCWSLLFVIRTFEYVFRLRASLHLYLDNIPKNARQRIGYIPENDNRAAIIASMANMISQGRVNLLLLPPPFDYTAWFDHCHTRALFFSLLKACRDSDTLVIIYDERELEDDFPPAFDRFLASSSDKDVREHLLKENIERVRIWEEHTAEHQLEFAPTREVRR